MKYFKLILVINLIFLFEGYSQIQDSVKQKDSFLQIYRLVKNTSLKSIVDLLYETEKNVMNELTKLGNHITLIVVAHRLSTLKNCDKLIRVKSGFIEEIESYEKMLKLNET